jgi:hypothetical protein
VAVAEKKEFGGNGGKPRLPSTTSIEGKIKGGIDATGRRGRRRRKLLDYLKAAFLKLWPADHKWTSGSALVDLLD